MNEELETPEFDSQQVSNLLYVICAVMVVLAFFVGFMTSKYKKELRYSQNRLQELIYALDEYSYDHRMVPSKLDYALLFDYGLSESTDTSVIAFNSQLLGKNWHHIEDSAIVFLESNEKSFSIGTQLLYLHQRKILGNKFALGITKSGEIIEYPEPHPEGKGLAKIVSRFLKSKEKEGPNTADKQAKSYNQCMQDQQRCTRMCRMQPAGSEENLSCSNDCYREMEKCTSNASMR